MSSTKLKTNLAPWKHRSINCKVEHHDGKVIRNYSVEFPESQGTMNCIIIIFQGVVIIQLSFRSTREQ